MEATPQSKVIGNETMNINKLYPWDQGGPCSYCKVGQAFDWSFTSNFKYHLELTMHPYTYEMLM